MIEAIENGTLMREQFDNWLKKIEGWGNQHIYLFTINNEKLDSNIWQNGDSIRLHSLDVGLGDLWNTSPSMSFPQERKLTGIYFNDDSFKMVWYEGTDSWVKEPGKNYQETIDTDTYEFRAYRKKMDRTVTRFEWPKGSILAGLFLQTHCEKKEHEELIEEAFSSITMFIPAEAINSMDIGTVIRNLDQAACDSNQDDSSSISPENTRLMTPGAFVDFGSTISGISYRQVGAVRDVRRTLDPMVFKGDRATFNIKNREAIQLSRDRIRMEMYGRQNRIRIAQQCSKRDVWEILKRITGGN